MLKINCEHSTVVVDFVDLVLFGHNRGFVGSISVVGAPHNGLLNVELLSPICAQSTLMLAMNPLSSLDMVGHFAMSHPSPVQQAEQHVAGDDRSGAVGHGHSPTAA